MRILITGASGFIGSYIAEELNDSKKYELIKLSRKCSGGYIESPPLTSDSNWLDVLNGVDVVIHLAARAHVLDENQPTSLQIFMEDNCHATINLAKQALQVGIKKFIFFSSIGVHAGIADHQIINSDSEICPRDNYAVSKAQAENDLRYLFNSKENQLIIIRPPLVYSGDAPGNFRRLLNLTKRQIPLPFGSIVNRRSMISVNNLTSLIKVIIDNESNMSGSFVVADDQVVSIGKVIKYLSYGMGKTHRIFKFSYGVLKLMARLVRKQATLNKIAGDFEIDNSSIKNTTGWVPKLKTKNELIRAGQNFIK